MKFWERCELKKNHLSMITYGLSKHLSNMNLLLTLEGFEALHNIVLNIEVQLLCSNLQAKVGYRYDELRQWFETFQQNVKELALNVKCKKIMHSRQMTMHGMFKRYNMNMLFVLKKIAHLTMMHT